MKVKHEIMVTVVVCTYNQEKWIRKTLDSILAQETEYPYEVIIGEDHGTDGTRAICQEYVEKVESGKWKVESGKGLQSIRLLPSTENLGVTANWIQCIQAGTGKYIMSCAGDDWWHSPDKIQMQVDFMEAHPKCCLSHTEINEYREESGVTIKNRNATTGLIPPEGRIQQYVLIGTDGISALSSCIRTDVLLKHVPLDEFAKRRFPREDWPTYLVISGYGDILYQPESTATYRVGQESITRTSDYQKVIARSQKDKEMMEYLYALLPDLNPSMNMPDFESIGNHNALLAAYRNNDYKSAKEFAKNDRLRTLATYMAHTWISFKLFRWIQQKRSKL